MAAPSPSAVGDRRQIGEVSVQVDVLSVVSTDVPRIVSGTLRKSHVGVSQSANDDYYYSFQYL